MPASILLGCGAHLPPRVVTSEALAPDLGLGAHEVQERSGIARRHYAETGDGPSDLARIAAAEALARAGADFVAVDRAIWDAASPAEAARRIRHIIEARGAHIL